MVGDAWGVELIRARVVAYPGASDFLREFEFLKLFPVSFQAFSVDAFNPKRIGRAQ